MSQQRKTKRKPRQSRKTYFLLTVLLLLGAICGVVGIGYWAHRDLDSPVAKRLRELVGIQPVEVPVREVVNEPEPPREPAKEPEPEPEPELPPEPEPRALSWSELTQDSRLWPEKLQITAKQTVPIQFNRINFGYVYFVPGDALQIESLEPDGLIYGSINGNYLLIAADRTDLKNWFSRKHAERYTLDIPEHKSLRGGGAGTPLTSAEMEEVMDELRQWCRNNYGLIGLELQEDALVVKSPGENTADSIFRAEAREIARHYLNLQAARGGFDNYAACRIIDQKTGALLGADSFFIPMLSGGEG